MKTCCTCGKETADGRNYCDWECIVNGAKHRGGAVHSPNGLPVMSVKRDDSMWEHEHADHPTYLFPVEVSREPLTDDEAQWSCGDGTKEPMDDDNRWMSAHQTHAVVFADRCLVLTMYECCYALWGAGGRLLYGSLWKDDGTWKLDLESLQQGLDRRSEQPKPTA